MNWNRAAGRKEKEMEQAIDKLIETVSKVLTMQIKKGLENFSYYEGVITALAKLIEARATMTPTPNYVSSENE